MSIALFSRAACRIYRSGRRSGKTINGDYMIQGFRNADIRESLFGTRVCAKRKKRLSAKVYRLFKKLHTRGLIVKIPHSRRWRITRKGHRVLDPLVEAYA